MTADPQVSVLIPALDEADRIEACLHRLARDFPACELVVADGGSTDGTAELALRWAKVVETGGGRGPQLNAAAEAAAGQTLWVHHVDTVTESAALPQLLRELRRPGVVGGGLTLRFDRRSPGLSYLAWTSNIRARRLGWIFGDQTMFVRRDALEAVGGFPDLPLMEDLEVCRRLRRVGELVVIPAMSTASSRRFDVHGTWPMVAFMQYLKVRHLCGADPAETARRYRAGPGHWDSWRPGHRSSTLASAQRP
jgi:rSAM/selenodomain-associated transferase 2